MISEEARKAKDRELNVAVDFLCKASGIFLYIADTVLPAWEVNRTEAPPGFNRPPELMREVNTALSKWVWLPYPLILSKQAPNRMVLADAQTLAIRRLQSKSAYESNIAPGPPLPASHPSPSLLAKLHLECASLYGSARSLVKSVGASKASSDTTGVTSEMRRYLADEGALQTALAHKWLGVFAGEKGGSEKAGEAVAFLAWAKKELEDLKDGLKSVTLGKGEKERNDRKKAKLVAEIASVEVFWKQYKKMNDTVSADWRITCSVLLIDVLQVHFQPVPPQADLQRSIPAGTLARKTTPYAPSQPTFGPNSIEYLRRKTEELKGPNDEADEPDHLSSTTPPHSKPGMYAGAGAYF